MGWNFIINDENPIWWHLGRIVQIKHTRVWQDQDRIGIVWHGDSSKESRTWWPGGWGPQHRSGTGGGGLARVPNLRMCKHPFLLGVAHAGGEGWINILPWYRPVGVAKPPVRRKGRRAGLPQKGWVSATRYGDDSPHLPWRCARMTGKAGENGQHSGAGRQLTLDKTVGSRMWWHSRPQQASATWLRGRYRLGHRPVVHFC